MNWDQNKELVEQILRTGMYAKLYGVKFLLYDEDRNPIGEFTSDDDGYVYITADDLPDGANTSGRFYLRELEAAEGYILDKEYKTVYVRPGRTAEIEWVNEAITGQIQIYKYAAEANSVTGVPAGTPLQGAVYEIINERSGRVVDYITTDARGVAASKPLPLTRYKIREVTAPAYFQLDPTVHDVTLEYAGQIIKIAAYDKPANLKVTVTKTGNKQLLAGDSMRYDLTVANNSNVPLENFYLHDRFPTDCATAKTITTGTYNTRLNYQITYKTNYNDYRVLATNLLSTNNYAFDLSAISLMQDEVVTDVRLEFGKVPAGFASVVKPMKNLLVRLGPKAPRYYVQIMAFILIVTYMITPALAVEDMWTAANRIIVDVYNKIAGISTVLAGLMSAVAVIGAKVSNNQHKTDQAWDWLKRIWIAWAIINGMGAFLAYVRPLFDSLATIQ